MLSRIHFARKNRLPGKWRLKTLIWIVIALFSVVRSANLRAQDYWTAAGANPPNGTWNLDDNWSVGFRPDLLPAGYYPDFNLNATYSVSLATNISGISGLVLNAGNVSLVSTDGTLKGITMSNSGFLTVNGGELSVGASTTGIALPVRMTVANVGVGSGGTLNVGKNSFLSSGQIVLGAGGNGTLFITDSGSSASCGQGVWIGSLGGHGQMEIDTSATLAAIYVADDGASNSSGSLIAYGSLNAGDIKIATVGGAFQSGSVEVAGPSGFISQSLNSTLTIGNNSYSTNNAEFGVGVVAAGGGFNSGGDIQVNKSGALKIGTATGATATVGSYGNLTVDGGNLTVGVSGALFIAQPTSLFSIRNGGTASFASGYTSTTGIVISGSGSSLAVSNTLLVSAAPISVYDGGRVTADYLTLNGYGSSIYVYSPGTLSSNFTTIAGTPGVSGPTVYIAGGNASLGDVAIGSNDGSQQGYLYVDSGSTVATGNILVNNNGGYNSLTMYGGSLTMAPDASLVTNGRINVGAGTFTSGSGTFVSQTGTVYIGSAGTVRLNGFTTILGQLSVVGGALSAGSVGLFGSGHLSINGGAVTIDSLNFQGESPPITFTSGSFTLASQPLTFGNVFQHLFDDAHYTATAEFVVNGGRQLSTGSNTVVLGGQLTIAGGSLTTQYIINRADGDAPGTVEFDSGTIVITGSAGYTVTSNDPASGLGASVDLLPRKKFVVQQALTISSDGSLAINGGELSFSALVNHGHFEFNSGTLDYTGTSDFVVGASGMLGANLSLSNRNLNVSHNINVNPGATLTLSGGAVTAGTMSNAGTIIVNSGPIGVTGAISNIFGGRIFVGSEESFDTPGTIQNAFGARIELQGGAARIGGAGALTNAGLVTGSGEIAKPLVNLSGGELRATGGNTLLFSNPSVVNNAGRLTLSGGTLEFSGALNNQGGGVISGHGTLIVGDTGLASSGQIQFSGGNSDVYGDVLVAGGSGSTAKITTASGGIITTFYGSVTNNKEIRTAAGSTSVFFGSVQGTGQFTGAGVTDFEGTESLGGGPGGGGAATAVGGSLILGPTNTLNIAVGGTTAGTGYGQINVANSVSIDGSLNLVPSAGFVPVAGDRFTILTSRGASGSFASINAAPGLVYTPIYTASQVQIVVSSSGDKTWGVDSDGVSSRASNWLGGVAPLAGAAGSGDSVAFGTFITTNRTVTVDSAFTTGSLKFDSPSSYTLAGTAPITLQATGAAGSSIQISSRHGNGAHAISVPLVVASDLSITQNSTGELAIAGSIDDTAAKNILVAGSGVTAFRGSLKLGALARVSVSSGATLKLATTAASHVEQGVTVTVDPGGTVELAGSNSALSDSHTAQKANVTNNGSLMVGDTPAAVTAVQTIGGLDGAGNLFVADNSTVLTDHVIQSMISIGAGGVLSLSPSNASGQPAAMIMDDGSGQLSTNMLHGSAPNSMSVAAPLTIRLSSPSIADSAPPSTIAGTSTSALAAVPEPSTAVLVLAAAALTLTFRRNRRLV